MNKKKFNLSKEEEWLDVESDSALCYYYEEHVKDFVKLLKGKIKGMGACAIKINKIMDELLGNNFKGDGKIYEREKKHLDWVRKEIKKLGNI